MLKHTGFLVTILILISGCTFSVEVMYPESSQPTPFPAQSTPSPANTPVVTISATAEPTITPVPPVTYPLFTNARMGISPDDPNRPTFFPAGTKAVHAIWDYQNMREGLMVRREWYWNGQPWITREEAWDFEKYGANGTIRDIRIFDNETGLNSGVYQLRLYVDNVPQGPSSGIGSPVTPWITFKIGTEEEYAGYMSPDNLSVVEVFDEKRVMLQASGGVSKKIFTAREVPYVSWFPDGRHLPRENAVFLNDLQRWLKESTRLGIPAIIHEESTAGFTARDATQFPQAIGLASSFDPDAVERMARVIRAQMLAVGARQTLAPVLDVARDPRWGRVEETFGEDPYLVSRLGVAYVRGVQGEDLRSGVAATGKHFIGYGLSEGGMNWAPAHVPPRLLRDVYALPFEAAIREAGLASVMNAYNEIDGLPCGGILLQMAASWKS